MGDLDLFPPFRGDLDALMQDEEVRAEYEASRAWWESMRWSVARESETELILFGQMDPVASGEPEFGYAIYESADGHWRPAGWGQCDIQATADGFGIATFTLDRDNPPDSAATSLHVFATERTCASGQAPTDRGITTAVQETPDVVEIVVLVELPGGAQTCQGNPSFPLTVRLGEPLGDRMIRDASIYPGTELPWPPPAPDPVLSVRLVGDAPVPGTANVMAWDGDIAGALIFGPDDWAEVSSDSVVIQTFYTPVTVSGFVTQCGGEGCVEECEAAACDAMVRVGPECTASYVPLTGQETIMAIRFSSTTCTIEITSEPLG